MDLKEFGRHLRELREHQGLGVREANRRSGVSSPYISQIERGDRRPSTAILERLAPVYGVPLRDLLEALGSKDDVGPGLSENEEVRRAFEYVVTDPRFQFGTRPDGSKLTLDAQKFVVQMYERLTGKRLLS